MEQATALADFRGEDAQDVQRIRIKLADKRGRQASPAPSSISIPCPAGAPEPSKAVALRRLLWRLEWSATILRGGWERG